MLLQGGGGWGWGGAGGVARWAAAQPSDTGGDTQPYFSWVFTRDLKVASASLRLKAFLDLPGFLHIRPCKAGKQTGETSEYNRRFQSERLPSGAAANQHLSTNLSDVFLGGNIIKGFSNKSKYSERIHEARRQNATSPPHFFLQWVRRALWGQGDQGLNDAYSYTKCF